MQPSKKTATTMSLENREIITITGIKRVKTTEPSMVVAQLDNCHIVISGQNLSVQSLSVRDGILELAGVIDSIKYTQVAKKSFSLKNMFK